MVIPATSEPGTDDIGDRANVGAADARVALERVLASEAFANTDRLSRFLRFTAEQTLDGRADRLKEYVLGVEVFDRPESFDPRIDSIVRVEARRLRGKLAEYYEVEGASDPVVIRLRKGGYVPRFELRNGAAPAAATISPAPIATPAAPRIRPFAIAAIALSGLAVAALVIWSVARRDTESTGPQMSIAVLPFEPFSADPAQQALADRLTDGVISQLARTPTLAVRSRTSIMAYRGARRPLRDIARALDVDLVMEGSVEVSADRVRVEARLVRAALDRKFWVDDFVGSTADLPALEAQIADAASEAIAVRVGRRRASQRGE